MTDMRKLPAWAMAFVLLTTTPAVAQNPKPPTPLPAEIQSADQLPILNAVTLWVDEQNLTAYIDSTSSPADRHMLTTLEVKWEGPGPGFVAENCDFENVFNGMFDVCTAEKIAKIEISGFGPVFSLGNLLPEGYLTSWNPSHEWIVDGSERLDAYDAASPYFGPVPEPSSLTLLCIGLLLLRKRQ